MKINSCWGERTDVSAKTKTVVSVKNSTIRLACVAVSRVKSEYSSLGAPCQCWPRRGVSNWKSTGSQEFRGAKCFKQCYSRSTKRLLASSSENYSIASVFLFGLAMTRPVMSVIHVPDLREGSTWPRATRVLCAKLSRELFVVCRKARSSVLALSLCCTAVDCQIQWQVWVLFIIRYFRNNNAWNRFDYLVMRNIGLLRCQWFWAEISVSSSRKMCIFII